MKIEKYITKRKFIMLSKEYISKTGSPLSLVNLKGDITCGSNLCNLCGQLVGGKNIILLKNCRLKMISAINEAFRWGEGYITTCPT